MASSDMPFSFAIKSALSKAGPRLGTLSTNSHTIATPNFLVPTTRGVVPHLTPDVLKAHTEVVGAFVALEDFLEKAPKAPIVECGLKLKQFIALPPRFLSVLGVRRVPNVATPLPNSEREVQVFTSVGFRKLLWDDYTKAILSLQPDVAFGLADIPNQAPGKQRKPKMVSRTEAWTRHLLKKMEEAGSNTAIFAPTLPLTIEEQKFYVEALEELKDKIAGLAVHDISILPELGDWSVELPKYSLHIPSTPQEILRQMELGIDLFNLHLMTDATNSGFAYTFKFNVEKEEGKIDQPIAVDLWLKENATDLSPLVEGCPCYTCQKHHKAFIQHMLGAKEMTAWNLLNIHNFHTMTKFFDDVRASIANGTYEQDKQNFLYTYTSELPEKTGEGPRLRGYQFKSLQGQTHKKANKPAFQSLSRGADEAAGIPADVDSKQLEDIGFAEKTDSLEEK